MSLCRRCRYDDDTPHVDDDGDDDDGDVDDNTDNNLPSNMYRSLVYECVCVSYVAGQYSQYVICS